MFHFMQDYIVSRSVKGKDDGVMKFNYEDIFERDSTQPTVTNNKVKRYFKT